MREKSVMRIACSNRASRRWSASCACTRACRSPSSCGTASATPWATPTVTLRVPAASALRYLVNADLAKLGEAYVEGHIDVEGPIGDAMRAAEGLARGWARRRRGACRRCCATCTARRSDAEAMRYHYDVSNDFYALWLDARMVYSCAYFRTGDESLEPRRSRSSTTSAASCASSPATACSTSAAAGARWSCTRRSATARRPSASRCRRTSTRSPTSASAPRASQDRCEVRLQDYRDVPGEGEFDKIASVGMFEHVGLKNLQLYFSAIRAPAGRRRHGAEPRHHLGGPGQPRGGHGRRATSSSSTSSRTASCRTCRWWSGRWAQRGWK